MSRFDAIVIGLGAMGSAAAWQLARRGLRVLGLEQFGVAHQRGSSHGQTRIIRKAYFEHPDYVPLLHRAYELWAELERAAGLTLFHRTGLLLMGPPQGEVIAGVRRSAAEHGLAIESVGRMEFERRFPGFVLRAEDEALFELDAGYLRVEDAVRAQIECAVAAGATVGFDERVLEWSSGPDGVRVRTAADEHQAARLVIAGGAWSSQLLRNLGIRFDVLRKVQLWFSATDERYRAERGCPAFCCDTGDAFFYGFPDIGGGEMKIAEHSGRESASADSLDRELHPRDIERVAAFLGKRLPGVDPRVRRHSVCMYTMTADGHFVVDRHPGHENVVFAAGFSGHGFKFAPLVGAVLADLALDGGTREPVGFLSATRPGLTRSS